MLQDELDKQKKVMNNAFWSKINYGLYENMFKRNSKTRKSFVEQNFSITIYLG